MVGRDLGGGVFVASRPPRYLVEIVPLPGTARLEPARGLRLPPAEPDVPARPAGASIRGGEGAVGRPRGRSFR